MSRVDMATGSARAGNSPFHPFNANVVHLFSERILPTFKYENGHVGYYIGSIIEKENLFEYEFSYKMRVEFIVKTKSNYIPVAIYRVSNGFLNQRFSNFFRLWMRFSRGRLS